MNIHKMELPKTVIVGNNILRKLSEIYQPLSSSKNIVLITGPHVFKKYYDEISNGIDKIDKIPKYFVYEASWDTINEIYNSILKRHRKVEYIIGMGGGKSIDVAKMISYKLGSKFISIPTAPSHDGIASQFVSIRDTKQAYSYLTKPPVGIIVDIEVVASAPKRLIASGVGDIIAKITAVKDWYLAKIRRNEYYGDYAANLALLSAKMVIKHSTGIGRYDKDSIRVLVEALISSGVAAGIAGSSRPCSGSEHLFSHALDIYSNEHALHGEQCGVGTIIMAYLHKISYEKIVRALKNAGAPTNAEELGISGKNIVKALVNATAVRPDRYTILNEVKMDERFAKKVIKEVGII